ncbi:MAG: CotS family spore coat protein [Clostridiaceae bacterium]|nr:CotS family spore coat protein [Clostridiaceae bacterium]
MMREVEIERQFNIKIENLKPSKGVYLLKTNQGDKCLKKIDFNIPKLLFVGAAKEHLMNNGFPRVDKYCLNVDGNPYALVNEDLYTLSDWIQGRQCDFHIKEDLVNAAKSLAFMHLSSKGYELPENSKLKTDLGRWNHLMDKRIKSFDKMRSLARKSNKKNNFDLNYIKTIDFFKDTGKKAMKILTESKYLELCELAEEEKGFCHHDYTYNNIIIDKNNEINIIDFEYCKREIRVFDISNFMIKVLKRNDWNIEFAQVIINAYNEVDSLKEEEYKVLYAFLLFPQRFWRLSNRYYYSEVNWSTETFNNKLEELIEEREIYMSFINNFKEIYSQNE